jgi:organic radical activating enzyme
MSTNRIKVSEKFFSFQSEGRFVGVPSIFLRTFGCNFRCKSFGCSTPVTDKYNPEVAEVIKNIDQFKTYEDFPLVNTGCDTYLSIYPEFQHLSPYLTIEELSTKFAALLPHNRWIQPNGNDVHLVITGGEPLLGWQREYPALLANEMSQGLRNVTFETNGTQPLKTELSFFINRSEQRGDLHVTFSVSPKLSASGEKWSDAIKPAVVADYENYGFGYLKFVVETPEHFDEVDQAVAEYRAAGFLGPVYVMPVGGVVAVYDRNEFHVATEALKRGYYFSPRLQITLWGNQWGT